jgi:hypothetical protein
VDRGDDAGRLPMRRALLLAALLLAARRAYAQGADEGIRRVSLGVQAGLFDVPRGHIGVPLQGDQSGLHMPLALVARWRMNDRMAFGAGFGIPQSGQGVSFWLSHELFVRLVTSPRGIVGLDLFEDAGLQLGFAGPDWYARHENEFVGYGYVYGGPLAFGLRLPVGLRATWLRGAFDTYIESVPLWMLTPSVEALFDLAFGIRIRL